MTDNKYIREAVELADGWEWKHSIQGTVVRWNIDNSLQMMQWPEDNLPIWIKDALAAQLVRQYLHVIASQSNLDGHPVFETDGDSMNTIKVVVDSKVLK